MSIYVSYLLMGIIVLSSLIGGGFYLYSSVIIIIPLLFMFLFLIFKNRKLKVIYDWHGLAIAVLIIGYLVTPLWAVDSGMAYTGFIKFLPVVLFFVIFGYGVKEKEKIKGWIPVFGTIMTISSIVMMFVPSLKEKVLIAERLAGFFQYPNTYALFMLLCVVISAYNIGKSGQKWLVVLNILTACAGVLLSGSRITLALMMVCIVIIIVSNLKGNRKTALYIVGGTVIAALAAFAFNREAVLHLISTNLSTFWGRLLYYFDALPLILRHPFGLGYYGYFFMHQEIQTGVYSLMHIHNDFLQIMLDIGWIPAILFYGVIVKDIFSKEVSARDKMVLGVIVVHSLFEFDLQFIPVMLVLVVFSDIKNVREFEISIFTKILVLAGSVAIIISSVGPGISDYCYSRGSYEKAAHYYNGNTMAKLKASVATEKTDDKIQYLESIIKNNEHVALAYSNFGEILFSQGDINGFMTNKEKALSLAPYQHDEYESYISELYYCGTQYIQMRDMNSASVCLDKMVETAEKLGEIEKRTSSLAWKIKDKPETELSEECTYMIQNMKTMIKVR